MWSSTVSGMESPIMPLVSSDLKGRAPLLRSIATGGGLGLLGEVVRSDLVAELCMLLPALGEFFQQLGMMLVGNVELILQVADVPLGLVHPRLCAFEESFEQVEALSWWRRFLRAPAMLASLLQQLLGCGR